MTDAEKAAKTRQAAASKAAHAQRQVKAVTRRLARLATSLRLWERRVASYQKQAAQTDAELAAARQKRLARAGTAKSIRGITLDGPLTG